MKYLPKVPDDAYVKVETTKILKQHKAYMAQFEEMLNDEKNRITTGTCKPSTSRKCRAESIRALAPDKN